ncbi:MAG: hypothetical protein HQK67_10320, partial [Desulfamplus sp.]|nr:hypothetical protein [Desulfamplus sp.]
SSVNRQLQKKRDLFARDIGKSIMLQAMENHGVTEDVFNSSAMHYFLTYKGYENIDQLLTNIGQSVDMPREVLWEVAEIPSKTKKAKYDVHPEELSKSKDIHTEEHSKTKDIHPEEHSKTKDVHPEEHSKTKDVHTEELSKSKDIHPEEHSKTKEIATQRFLLTISDIERDIHKFSQCCKPVPGIDSCFALLNRDGVSLHREYCEKYKKEKEYALNRIQIMDVIWDMKVLWKVPLTFCLRTSTIDIKDTIQMIAAMPVAVDIHLIQKAASGNGIDISVTFHNFNESKFFFSCFENKNCQVEIQDYGRHEFIIGREW